MEELTTLEKGEAVDFQQNYTSKYKVGEQGPHYPTCGSSLIVVVFLFFAESEYMCEI